MYNENMKKLYEGTISCKSILEAGKRTAGPLYVDPKKRTKDFSYIIHLARKAGIQVIRKPREQLDEMAGSRSHGGMLLEAGERLIPQIGQLSKTYSNVYYIEGVEDPYNLGSVCRTVYAAGADLLVLPPRDWSSASSTILKASAGAYEKLEIAYADEEQLIEFLHRQAIELVCAYRKDARALADFVYPKKCCIALGGAMRGLSKKIIEASDHNVYIQYGRDFRNALDTASSTAVFAFDKLNKEIFNDKIQ